MERRAVETDKADPVTDAVAEFSDVPLLLFRTIVFPPSSTNWPH